MDNFYKNRREHGIIVSMACTKPAETCFCGTFGIDAASPAGDIVCHKTDDTLYLDAKTEKGAQLPGNLSLTADRILTCLSLLIPAFSLLEAPHVLSVMLHRR